MRDTAFRLRPRQARDWGLARDIVCLVARTGELAMGINDATFPHWCFLRPPAPFHFFSEISSQAKPMLSIAHRESPSTLVGVSRALLIPQKTQVSCIRESSLTVKGRRPSHAEPTQCHRTRGQKEGENECNAS